MKSKLIWSCECGYAGESPKLTWNDTVTAPIFRCPQCGKQEERANESPKTFNT